MIMDKILIGGDAPLLWQPARDQEGLCVKLPLEVDGQQSGQSLYVQAFPNYYSLRFSIAILYEPAICRLDF